jgi:homoserine acetyltransferase
MSIASPYYTHEFHGDYDLVSVGKLDLEEGGSIPDCQLAVTTWGELNDARDNAILITTWYSGTHQIWRRAGTRRPSHCRGRAGTGSARPSGNRESTARPATRTGRAPAS